MAIDILFIIFLLLAIIRGLRHGFIIAVVSTAAWIIGIAAAIKLSAVVAGYGKTHTHLPPRWLPVLAFLLVFLAVVIGLHAIAKLIEKAVDLAMMGWLNKVMGVLLYAFLFITTLSVLLFYAVQVHLISSQTVSASVTYPYISPWGRVTIDEFGKFVPWFEGMFVQLEDFFGRIRDSH
ncbi:MAG TPA: CvpA family protein [Puia sp.]|jgi:membrane protein required for colicin V production